MAKVGAQRAAELTGKSKSTIQRAMNCGKLSYEIDNNDRRVIDVSELERVFGLSGSPTASNIVSPAQNTSSAHAEAELKRAADMIEMERMKMKIKALEDQLDMTNSAMDDLRAQRDQWQKQAQQVLITSQYSQQQAEEYKNELRNRDEMERRRREQREKIMQERGRTMQGQNQNAQQTGNRPTRPGGQERGRVLTQENISAQSSGQYFDFKELWKKIKGEKVA